MAENKAGGAAGPQAPPPLFADWFRSRGYVWSDERECWCIAWNHRSGYDFTDLEFSTWHNAKHPTRWEAIIGHHASGSNPRMSIGCCDSEADLERTHQAIRAINEPEPIEARGDAARVPPTPQGWQPIETMPHGQSVLVTDGHDVQMTCIQPHSLFPTHWMPLPAAPATPQEK